MHIERGERSGSADTESIFIVVANATQWANFRIDSLAARSNGRSVVTT
jgi:hypothetical protein